MPQDGTSSRDVATCGQPLAAGEGELCGAQRLPRSDRCLAHHPERSHEIIRLLSIKRPLFDFYESEVNLELLNELFHFGVIGRSSPSSGKADASVDTETSERSQVIDIDFRRTLFPEIANFQYAWFHRHARFNLARFKAGANFKQASFTEYASFQGATFNGSADFSGAVFRKRARFMYAAPSDDFLCRDATFFGDAHFLRLKPTAIVDVAGSNFYGSTTFSRIRFPKLARFDDVTFNGVDFAESKFLGNAEFNNARFLGHANFHRSRFSGGVAFVGVKFQEQHKRSGGAE